MDSQDALELEVQQLEGLGSSPRRCVTAIVIGCGNRGQAYSSYALEFPRRLKIVGVVDPAAHRTSKLRRLHDIVDDVMVASEWRHFANMEKKVADIAIITTPDKLHKDPAVAFANLGYHLLLEKPMAVDESDCEEIAAACNKSGVLVAVCHVLRYFPPCLKIREVIDSGAIGQVVNINHVENVGFWHFAHSFVRGNWRNVEDSTFSLLAKCCHDLDLIKFWMGDRKCTKVQSFGGLHHFKPSQAPSGAAKRCLDCPAKIESSCPYSAKKIYLDKLGSDPTVEPTWPMSVVCDIEDHPGGYREALTEALRTGPYGRCVYFCDNNVNDHQTVNMQFGGEGCPTAVLTMNAFTRSMKRKTVVSGTHGELVWDGSAVGPLLLHDFRTDSMSEVFPESKAPTGLTKMGHGGADFFTMNNFVRAVANDEPALIGTGVLDSLETHRLVFAAEKSRIEGKILNLMA